MTRLPPSSSRRYALGAVAFAVAGPVAGAANFAFHALASRSLGPDAYGGLSALLVLTVAVAVPAAALQMSLAKALLNGDLGARRLLSSASRVAVVVVAVLAATAPLVAAALRLGGPLPVLALSGYLAATVVGLVPKAVLVAEERLGHLAGATLLGVAVRLGLGAALFAAGGGLTSAVTAGSVAEAVSLVWLLAATAPAYRDEATGQAGWRAHVAPVLALGGLWVLLGLDTVAARLFLGGGEAGNYAAAAVLAKAVLFLPQSVATATFARLSDPRTRPRALSWGTAAVLGLAALSTLALAGAGIPVARSLFGSEFAVDPAVLVVLAVATSLVALVNLWVHARVATGQPVALRVLGPVVLAAVGAPVAAATPLTLALWALAMAGLALVTTRPATMVAPPFPDPTRILAGPPGLEVSVVVPLYQGQDRVVPHLRRVVDVLLRGRRRFEVIVVDDGSTDAGPAQVREADLVGVRLERVTHGGKGHALTAGLAEAKGEVVGFIDADGDIDAEVLRALLHELDRTGADVAVAVKAVDGRSGLRRLATHTYRRLVALLLDTGVGDTQTGAKLFRRPALAAALPWVSEPGYAFDPELLSIMRRLGHGAIAEVPVEVRASRSTIRPADVLAMARATTRVATRVAQLPLVAAPTRLPATPRRPLRILVLTWKCHRHPAAGGAERYTHEVVRRWAAQGHRVTLFVPEVDGGAGEERVDGYRIVRRGTRFTVYREARTWWADHHDAFDVIVDQCNTRPFEAPLWADVPVVALYHQLAREVWWHETPLPVAAAGRFVLEPSWLRVYREVPVATVSESSAVSLRRAGLGQVVNVGVGLELPRQLPRPAQGDEPTVAFVARLVSAKRPLDAMVGFALAREQLGEGRMWIMGDGPMRATVEREAAAIPGVEVLGRVSEAEKFERLARSHVLAVTSVREGWGLVVDEAAAVGCHPVGYRVPGLVDSVPAAGGDLVDPDPGALAAGLCHRLPEVVGRPGLSRSGGARSWDDVAERFLATLRTAVEGAATPVAPIPNPTVSTTTSGA